MWNSRQSKFLLIRVSQGGPRRLVIPIPLFVLDITLAAFSDLAVILDSLGLKWLQPIKRYGRSKFGARVVSLEGLLKVVLQLFGEMRKYGRWTLVEVQAGKLRVFIDFY